MRQPDWVCVCVWKTIMFSARCSVRGGGYLSIGGGRGLTMRVARNRPNRNIQSIKSTAIPLKTILMSHFTLSSRSRRGRGRGLNVSVCLCVYAVWRHRCQSCHMRASRIHINTHTHMARGHPVRCSLAAQSKFCTQHTYTVTLILSAFAHSHVCVCV